MQRSPARERFVHLLAKRVLHVHQSRAKIRVRAVTDMKIRHSAGETRNEFLKHGCFHIGALDANAYAAAVCECAIRNPFGCPFQVTVGEDEAGVLSSKLHDGWDKVSCRTLCDLPPVAAAAREEYDVRAGVDERRGFFGAIMH